MTAHTLTFLLGLLLGSVVTRRHLLREEAIHVRAAERVAKGIQV